MKDEKSIFYEWKRYIKAFERCTNGHGSCNACMYCFTKYAELRCDAKKRNRDILNIIYNLEKELENLRNKEVQK